MSGLPRPDPATGIAANEPVTARGRKTVEARRPDAQVRLPSARSVRDRYRLVAYGQATTDAVSALVVIVVFGVFDELEQAVAVAASLVAAVAWAAVFRAFGLDRMLHLAMHEEFRRIFSATSVGVLLLAVVSGLGAAASLSGQRLGAVWVLLLVLELVTRRLWRTLVRSLKRKGSLTLRTLVIGANDEAAAIARQMGTAHGGFSIVGFVAPGPDASSRLPAPLQGSLDRVADVIQRLDAECLLVESSSVAPDQMVELARLCRVRRLEMRVSANLPEVLTSRLSMRPVGDVILISVTPARFTRTQEGLKRAFDLVAASTVALIALPVMAAIALAIRTTSAGPILFRQRRVTKGGRLFTVYKFRTMISDPQKALEGKLIDLTQPFFKLEDDPRLTRVGKVIRSLSLDELPQLWNIIKGDMSLVGPRPLPVDQVEANAELLGPRHEVRAGLTGWWQVNGRSDVEPERALKMDIFYIENWSLSLDIHILAETVVAVFAKRGAR